MTIEKLKHALISNVIVDNQYGGKFINKLCEVFSIFDEYETVEDWASDNNVKLTGNQVDDSLSIAKALNVEIKVANDIDGLYVQPDYGWDGGNAIGSDDIGLYHHKTTYLTIWCGPGAQIVKRLDSRVHGFTFYSYDADDSRMIVIY